MKEYNNATFDLIDKIDALRRATRELEKRKAKVHQRADVNAWKSLIEKEATKLDHMLDDLEIVVQRRRLARIDISEKDRKVIEKETLNAKLKMYRLSKGPVLPEPT